MTREAGSCTVTSSPWRRPMTGFDPDRPARRFHAILVDIDHSPEFLLDPGNAAFYQPEGLSKVAAHLRPGGVFGLWSNDEPDEAFTARLGGVFAEARAEPVTFHNPLQNREADPDRLSGAARQRMTTPCPVCRAPSAREFMSIDGPGLLALRSLRGELPESQATSDA